MPIYLVVPLTVDSSKLDAAVSEKIKEESRYPLQSKRGWLVQFPGTTVELSHTIGISHPDRQEKPATDSALVTPVPNYFGRGPTDMWEWLSTRIEK